MYQEAAVAETAGVVEGDGEGGEYHIMYDHYGTLTPGTPPTTTTLTLGRGGGKEEALNTLVPTPLINSAPCSGSERTHGLRTLAVTSEGLEMSDGRALVTSMVAPGECQGGNRKVIVKVFNGNTFSLDIIAAAAVAGQEEDSVAPHHMLTRNGALVHAKLSDGTLIHTQGEVHEGSEGVNLAPSPETEAQEGSRVDEDDAIQCQVMWTCAYCSLILSTSEAMASHQQVCAKSLELQPLQTTTSQTTVDALMSPLRSQEEEPTYHLKIESASEECVATTVDEEPAVETQDMMTVWVCAVCKDEFTDLRGLGSHLPTHTAHQLAAALLHLASPCQKVRPRVASPIIPPNHIPATPSKSTETDPLSIDSGERGEWPNGRSEAKLEEEGVDNPGETPPQTPPQEKPPARRTWRKSTPRSQDKEEKRRKYRRKKKEEEVVSETGTEVQNKELHLSTGTTTIVSTITNTQSGTSTATPGKAKGSREPHHCEVCNKKLSSRGNLAKHLIRHRAEKPFECNICQATFNANRDRKNHYLQHHTNWRPNRCNICGKSYVDRNYLRAHMFFHRNQKAFSCEVCGKKFNTSRCVTRHKMRHEEEKRFVCDICFRAFAVKADLTSHKRKVHKKQQQQQQQQQTGAGKPQQQQQEQQQQQQQQQQAFITQQAPVMPVTTQAQDQESQVGKSKDLTEFLLPGVVTSPHMLSEQLLPPDLSAGAELGSSVSKGGIFISGDPLTVSSLISGSEGDDAGGGECSYRVALTDGGPGGTGVAGEGGQPAYIMINDNSDTPEKGVSSTSSGLSIMYANTASLAHQVGGLEDIQQLSGSVGANLVGEEGQLDLGAHLEEHHHHHHHTQTHNNNNGTGALTTRDSGITHTGDLQLEGTEGGAGTLVGRSSGHNTGRTHDANSTFPLELLSQTYQLDLQRTQTTSNYLA